MLQRNDMVEYFGEQLHGFAFTVNGPNPITVFWSKHSQSLTARPMKGMLTGPITILNWSFVRNDQPR